MLLPKVKNGSSDDMEDDEVGQGELVEGAAGEQAEEDSGEDDQNDEAPRGYMDPRLLREVKRLPVRQDVLAHLHQLQADRVKHNTAYFLSLMQYYHGPTSSSTALPQPRPPFKFPPWPPATPELAIAPTDEHIVDEDLPDV